VEFCKIEIRLILFKEISFGISLNNPSEYSCVCGQPLVVAQGRLRDLPPAISEGKIRKTIFPSKSKPDLYFSELLYVLTEAVGTAGEYAET
jgi:hypothetical protein